MSQCMIKDSFITHVDRRRRKGTYDNLLHKVYNKNPGVGSFKLSQLSNLSFYTAKSFLGTIQNKVDEDRKIAFKLKSERTTKVCADCKVEKILSDFNWQNISKNKRHPRCKSCYTKVNSDAYNSNKIERNNQSRNYYLNNVEKSKKEFKERHLRVKDVKNEYRRANREYSRETERIHRLKFPEKYKAKESRRRASKLKATPKWVDLDAIVAIYKEASEKGLTVDHIVPLKSKIVCGLHVPWNLQLLTFSENASKGNRHWPDMPLGEY